MQIPNDKLKELLIKDDLIKPEEFDGLLREADRMKQNVADVLISRGLVSSGYFYNMLAKYYGSERANLGTNKIDENILRLLPEDVARIKRAIAFRIEKDGRVGVAMEDPSDLELISFLRRYLRREIEPYLASLDDLRIGFQSYVSGGVKDFEKVIEESVAASLALPTGGKEEKVAKELPIVAIVDNLINYAISSRASDIHLEILESA